ncbi:MAG: S8 family serine peptidase [Melioribacter sp.]|uniref:S8 family serine peptidase n=1 Tax=Rosettibacter primus TaxID=3111523 RepID=UPI00247B8B12|nr:S8 family serine peptidase [Melioribacter sp.]
MNQNNLLKLSFEKLTGANIKVAVIDSGIDKSNSMLNRNIYKMKDYTISSTYNMNDNNICKDFIGHGTACAGIITKNAPEVELLIIKIFDKELNSSYDLLLKAIDFAIEDKVNIINLSLGMTQQRDYSELQKLCNKAYERNIVIVAAENPYGLISYPASFDNVFSVKAGKIHKKYGYSFNNDGSNKIIARGDHQRVLWLDNRSMFVSGSSFAVPYISGIIALIMQAFPGVRIDQIKEILASNSEINIPELLEKYEINPCVEISKEFGDIIKQQNFSWIKRAIIYPFNKEMHSLVRFRKLLPFDIVGIFDEPSKLLISSDSGDVIGIEPTGIIIESINKIDLYTNQFDTCILGYLDEVSRIKKKDVLKEVALKVLNMGKNIYSLSQIYKEPYKELYELALKKNLVIRYSSIDPDLIRNISLLKYAFNKHHSTPKIGIFGTSSNQGKFTTQLTLYDEMTKAGYKVATISTEHQSELFGVNFTFPMGYGNSVNLPIDAYSAIFRGVLFLLDTQKYDIIILAGQSGIIPYEIETYSPTYTLTSIAMLFSTNPDAYILCINYNDSDSFVSDCIHALEILGKAKTILLVFSDHTNETKFSGHKSFSFRKLTPSEIYSKIEHLESKFSIPATEVISDNGKKKLLDTVINYFS